MTLTISKYQLSKQQHTITLNYTIGENLNHFSHLCRNFFPRIGLRFEKHEMVWLPWQPGPSNKQHYSRVLLSSFHLNGHTLGFHPQTQKLDAPCKSCSPSKTVPQGSYLPNTELGGGGGGGTHSGINLAWCCLRRF